MATDDPPTDRINLPGFVWLVPAAVVLWAMLPVANTYYEFARLIACSSAALLAYRECQIRNETTGWTILLAIAAIVRAGSRNLNRGISGFSA